jgi:TonB-linked SusC/RagA family outer membrane protein
MKQKSEQRAKNSFKTMIHFSFLRACLVMLGLVVYSMAYSQSRSVTINLSNVTVEEVFNAIKSQSNYTVAYGNSDVALKKKVSVNVQNRPVEEVVKQALAGQEVTFTVSDNHIILAKQASVAGVGENKVKITGKITGADGEELIGASISEKGTTNGTVSDLDGSYNLAVGANSTLVVSYIGYLTTEINVDGKSNVDVVLLEDARTLNEVVVTALGIRKKEKSLTYSTQIVEGGELTRAKDPNMITALAGKTAGVQISKSASGLGGSAKVIIRGNRSASGNNQPLYVIDGIPINNTLTDQTVTSIGGTNDAGNRDGGDGISNLNSDDIESMNILKGPAAAALYGSQAANGVIVITTKKGKAGTADITFNTSTTWDQAAYGIPKFQNRYTGVTSSWGSAITGGSPDYTKEFFKTGVTTINSLSLSSGSEKMQTYFSYANTYGEGVIDNNELVKHNLNFRETANFFNDKVILDANINLLHQKLDNGNTPGGYYNNPLVGLYHFPRGGVEGGKSFDYYKENYKIFYKDRNLYTQNWYTTDASGMEQNPYWLINKTPTKDIRARGIINLTLTYKINNLFTLQARGNTDFISDKYNQKMYVGTSSAFAGDNGRYITYEATHTNTYGDILLTHQGKYGEDFTLNASVGSSVTDQKVKSIRLDSRPGSLYFPNVFTVSNMHLDGGYIEEQDSHRREQALFFAGQLGYKDWLFLDVTARNDWSSTLAYTRNDKNGFFYPSAGLTWIINESLSLPEWIYLGKIRGAWSQVGNALPLYISHPINKISAGGNFQGTTTAPFSELKPEKTNSLEFGTEWRFFGNRVEFDFTYYKTNTTNQLFSLPAPSGSGHSYYYVNAGDIENRGVEIVLGGSPLLKKDYRWKTAFNFSTNQNKVLELAEGLDYFAFGQQSSNNYQMRLEKGGSFGDIYGVGFIKDADGNIRYDAAGLPLRDNEAGLLKIANCAPKWSLGWSNTFTYKDFSLFFLIDGRFGGDVLSITQADLDSYGVSKATGDARNAGHVSFDGKNISDVRGFYGVVGGRAGITEYYVYDATNIRLRELSLGYNLPKNAFGENGVIKGCEISLIGRNLFFLMNNAPYDPDASLSTGNNLQGVDVFGMPTNRSFGVNLKLKF